MLQSGDIMGKVNTLNEQAIGGACLFCGFRAYFLFVGLPAGVSLFVNADAGDVDPGPGMCNNKPIFTGATIISQKIVSWRQSIVTQQQLKLKAASQVGAHRIPPSQRVLPSLVT